MLKELWNKLLALDNKPLEDEITILQKDKDELLDGIENAEEGLHKLYSENIDLSGQLAKLSIVNNQLSTKLRDKSKHQSIAFFKNWTDFAIKQASHYYDFGHGSGKQRTHTIFSESIKDEAIIKDFIKNTMVYISDEFGTADDLVLSFCKKFSAKYPTRSYYRIDRDIYERPEYWALAKETIELIEKDKIFGDCDDVMTLKYSCLYWLLKESFPNDLWRLRGFIVDLWTGAGHAMLGWVKEGINDWVPIETTFYDFKQSYIWSKDFRIRNQMLYKIRYSFDNETEYDKI